MAGRHPDVDDREVRSVLANELDQLGGVAGLAHNLEAGALEQARQTFTEKDVVVCQHHARAARVHAAIMGVPWTLVARPPAPPGSLMVDSR
jgi:hypothetical protein